MYIAISIRKYTDSAHFYFSSLHYSCIYGYVLIKVTEPKEAKGNEGIFNIISLSKRHKNDIRKVSSTSHIYKKLHRLEKLFPECLFVNLNKLSEDNEKTKFLDKSSELREMLPVFGQSDTLSTPRRFYLLSYHGLFLILSSLSVARVCNCLLFFFVCLEFQIIRFVIITSPPILFLCYHPPFVS
mgnify:CR=1 FL=1